VGFVVDKVALGQVFSEYFGFPCQSSFHQLLHNHPHLSSGAGTIGQKWPQYKGPSPTPLAIKKNKDFLFRIKPLVHLTTKTPSNNSGCWSTISHQDIQVSIEGQVMFFFDNVELEHVSYEHFHSLCQFSLPERFYIHQ
jgi:hypothetical protein